MLQSAAGRCAAVSIPHADMYYVDPDSTKSRQGCLAADSISEEPGTSYFSTDYPVCFPVEAHQRPHSSPRYHHKLSLWTRIIDIPFRRFEPRYVGSHINSRANFPFGQPRSLGVGPPDRIITKSRPSQMR